MPQSVTNQTDSLNGFSLVLMATGGVGLAAAVAVAGWLTLGQADDAAAPIAATPAAPATETRAQPAEPPQLALAPSTSELIEAIDVVVPSAVSPAVVDSAKEQTEQAIGGIVQHLGEPKAPVVSLSIAEQPGQDTAVATPTVSNSQPSPSVTSKPARTSQARRGLSRQRTRPEASTTPSVPVARSTSTATSNVASASTEDDYVVSPEESPLIDKPEQLDRLIATGDGAPLADDIEFDDVPLSVDPDELAEVGAPAEDEADGLTAEERYERDVAHFVSFYNIAWSTRSPPHRNIGWGVATRGWPTFVRFHIEPQIEQGVRRFQLHNPFGAIAGEVMQLDQLIHARESGLQQVTNDFVEAWAPVTAQGIEVIAYLGCGTHDPDFNDLPIDEWLERAFEAVQPCLDAGMSIALDAAIFAPEGSPTHVFAERLRDMGVKVYVEAKPTRSTPHWYDFNVIALDQTWLNSDIETGHPQARKFYGIPDELLTGEVARMIRPRTGETWQDLDQFPVIHQRIRDILDDGHTVVAAPRKWFERGYTLRQLLYIDNRRASFD